MRLLPLYAQLVAMTLVYACLYGVVVVGVVALTMVSGSGDANVVAGAFQWTSKRDQGAAAERGRWSYGARLRALAVRTLRDLLVFGPVRRKFEEIRYERDRRW
ncbi:hypothetical protein ACTWP5_09275 [Streptomyces sp. 4N509B]|uniref:hypothetical protein n=1 Tax=Streptomyces sp. 4N509B TaxID=3457413 RepID=UPI003FD586BD